MTQFGASAFYTVVHWHKQGEYTLHISIVLPISMPKIIKFDGDLTKFWQKQVGLFLWPTLYLNKHCTCPWINGQAQLILMVGWQMIVYDQFTYYDVGHKRMWHFTVVHIFTKYWPILKIIFFSKFFFQNSFTGTLCGQLAIMWLLYILPHCKCVSTLPCEI